MGITTIDVRKAVKSALDFFTSVMLVPAENTLLEEVELTEDERFWLVTFSFPARASSGLQTIMGGGRSFKTVKIDATTGLPLAIKITKA